MKLTGLNFYNAVKLSGECERLCDHMSRRVIASRLISVSKSADSHLPCFLPANLAAGTIPAEIGKLTVLKGLYLFGNARNPLKLSGKLEPQRFPFHDHMPRRVIGENQLLLT